MSATFARPLGAFALTLLLASPLAAVDSEGAASAAMPSRDAIPAERQTDTVSGAAAMRDDDRSAVQDAGQAGSGMGSEATAGSATGTSTTTGSSASSSSPDWIRLVSARDLVGRTLHARDGQDLGEIRYVGIRLADGRARFIALAPEQGPDDELAIVPFDALDTSWQDEIRIAASASQVKDAPKLRRESLSQLTQPAQYQVVREFWGPLGLAQRESGPGSGSTSGTGTSGANAAGAASGSVHSGAPDVAAGPQGAGTSSTRAARPGSGSGAQSGSTGSAQGAQAGQGGSSQASAPHVLVGRSVVSVLAPPAYRFQDQLRGSPVTAADGSQIGEIEQVVLDMDRGRVAYAVIASGVLFDRSWYAVPFETLAWSADGETIRLMTDRRKLQEIDALDASHTPMRVKPDTLARLYQRFDATPYWKGASAEGASSPAAMR